MLFELFWPVRELEEVLHEGERGVPERAPILARGWRRRPAGLPFPGEVSFTCKASERVCVPPPRLPGQAKSSIDLEATEAHSRSKPVFRDDGRQEVTLQVATTLRGKAFLERKSGGGDGIGLDAFYGRTTAYGVTVSPERAKEISEGKAPAPHPLDPRSLATDERLLLSKESYLGGGLEASYRRLQALLGYEKGRRVSTGVERLDGRSVRVHIGDERVVRNAMGLGLDNVAVVSLTDESTDGRLRTIDLDISTPEGWDAYQRFVTSGRLPSPVSTGTSEGWRSERLGERPRLMSSSPRFVRGIGNTADTRRLGWRRALGLKIGPSGYSPGGPSSEVIERTTRHPDGSTDITLTHLNGKVISSRTTPAGADESPDAKNVLILGGVDRGTIENFGQFGRVEGKGKGKGKAYDIRLDFTEAELERMRGQSLKQLSAYSKRAGKPLTTEQIAERLRQGDSVIPGFDLREEIAAADGPAEVLALLTPKAESRITGTVDFLVTFGLESAFAERKHPRDHPENARPPGRMTLLGSGGN